MSKVKLIRMERVRRGWTQTQLGCFSGLSAADISKIESGHLLPYPGQAARLAAVLGLGVGDLLIELEPSAQKPDPPGSRVRRRKVAGAHGEPRRPVSREPLRPSSPRDGGRR